MSDTDTTVTTLGYDGPAGVVFTHDELLVIWSGLTRIPSAENGSIREKIQRYLERKEDAK